MVRRLTEKDFKVMPWKNGGGMTCELYRLPWLRLSRAKVLQDGPFSKFEGIHRHLIILKGSGVRLDGIEFREGILEFEGEEDIHCELIEGPVEDFNVMVERKSGKAVVSDGQTATLDSGYHYLPNSNELFVVTTSHELAHETRVISVRGLPIE